ncbi:MAG: energy-coupling factor transporter transmembrane protein EcfT [Propionibacteriaceae bacterium]|nr:energy-coupling factor transporter transmembrane protein EcfT [Propionibacteriaceae bacterium]
MRWLDRVNPVSRLGAAIILSVALLLSLDPVSAGVVVIGELLVALVVGVPFVALLRRLLPIFVAAPLAGVSTLLYSDPGGRIHFSWGLVTISDQSIGYAFAIMLRIVALGLAVVVALWRVDPTDMADGLAQVWRLPARFVLGTLAGIRLIGRLRDDWRSLELARRARGLGDQGRFRRWAGLAFALLVSAVRRGSTLATAMEARGFGAGPRTWARPSTTGRADVVCLLVAFLIAAAGLGIAWLTGAFRWIGSV